MKICPTCKAPFTLGKPRTYCSIYCFNYTQTKVGKSVQVGGCDVAGCPHLWGDKISKLNCNFNREMSFYRLLTSTGTTVAIICEDCITYRCTNAGGHQTIQVYPALKEVCRCDIKDLLSGGHKPGCGKG